MTKSITSIDGVFGSGIHCGIKSDSAKKDLGLIYIPQAYSCAGVFTQNQFPASSVVYTKKYLKKGGIKAVIVNSGNANAGTGELGIRHTKQMAKETATVLGLLPSQVAVASTGKIGQPLPIETVVAGIQALGKKSTLKEGSAISEAILTTDLVKKEVYLEKVVGKRKIIVAGMTKGSGMIAPNMATTLTFLATNVPIDQVALQKRFQEAINLSYNMLSVDTDTSTNDMALLFSVGGKDEVLTKKEEWVVFESLLTEACITLAKMIAKDGEGATKLIEVQVNGAANQGDARKIALNVVNSPLVKTAIHGSDPNWGRIVAAACRDPKLKINSNKLALYLGDTVVFSNGEPTVFLVEAVSAYLKADSVVIRLELGLGKSKATAWGCDLTHGYVDINTQYC